MTMDKFFHPKSIAVIGASATVGKVGYAVLLNLIQYGFGGKIYPVNPTKPEILNLPCYPSVLNVPGKIDLAIVIVPAAAMTTVIDQCGEKGVEWLIIISSGFKETGGRAAENIR